MDQETVTELAIYNEAAEMAVVGCMLVEPSKCCEAAIEGLQPSDFFVKLARTLFVVMSSMWTGNRPIDVMTVNQEAKAHGSHSIDETVCGMADSMEAFKKIGSLSGYISMVKTCAKSRDYQTLGLKLIRMAQSHDGIEEKQEIAAQVTKRLDELSTGAKVEVFTGDKPWNDFYESMANPKDDGNGAVLVTGYGQLDEAVKIRGGQVIVIAAVQKQGKSSLALNLAVRWWSQQIPGTVCSLEMRLHDLQALIMSNTTGITRDAFEERKMDDAKLATLFQSTMQAKGWPYAIFERPALKAREFRLLAREQARRGSKFFVLDYFQLMQTDRQGHSDNRAAELEENMRIVKCTALETGLAIVLLSQLNTKQVDGKTDNRPTLAHLRGTGAIAQDADVVMLLSEPKPENRPNGMRQLVGDIAANRRGPEKDISWLLDGAHARFLEC